MLRAAVKAGTPVGRQTADIMARGALVPDDLVVAIVSERIAQQDAKRGFILDGFPRTVPQAEALEQMLGKKGLRLDAVIAFNVDEDILLHRVKTRIAQMRARGETLRADDNPEALQQRVAAYKAQTAPLTDHYARKGLLKSVNGMASIDEVTAAIGRALAETAFRPGPAKGAGRGAAKKAVSKAEKLKKASAKGKAGKKARAPARPVQVRRKAAKSRGKARPRRLTK